MTEVDPRTAPVPEVERIGDRVVYENHRVRVWHAAPWATFADFDTGPGHVLWEEGGVTETAVNTGERPYRNVLVELKDQRP